MVTGWAVAYEKGWNAVVRAAAARGETDAVSLRRKVTTLDAMKARFESDAGFEIPRDGGRARDPSGRWELAADEFGDLRVGDAGATELDRAWVRIDGARCLFADDDSTLWIRFAGEWNVSWVTVDLPRRAVLQRFHESTGKPRPAT